MRRLLGISVLGLGLLASACGDPFDCTIVQCDGLYEADLGNGTTRFLRFYGSGTVVSVISDASPDQVGTWLDDDFGAAAKGKYSLSNDETEIDFTVSLNGALQFGGDVAGDQLQLEMTDMATGAKEPLTFVFVSVAFD